MSKSRASKQKGYKSLLTPQRNDIYKVPSNMHRNVIVGKK